jgi:hypothetical protein
MIFSGEPRRVSTRVLTHFGSPAGSNLHCHQVSQVDFGPATPVAEGSFARFASFTASRATIQTALRRMALGKRGAIETILRIVTPLSHLGLGVELPVVLVRGQMPRGFYG